MHRVILITGKAYSGKDTTADYIVRQFLSNGVNAKKVALADKLKIISQQLIKLFYGIEIPLTDFYDQVLKDEVRQDLPTFAGKPFSLRSVLQHVGTNIFRDNVYTNIWCEILHRDVHDCDVLVVSDCRFQNEVDYFAKLVPTTVIKIYREPVISMDHESENQKISTNFILWNMGSIEQLYENISIVLNYEFKI